MQSPLTPQRGRIESNPREYTHKERPACGELAVMPPGSRCVLAVRDRTSEEIHSHFPAVRKSTLVRHPCISRLSLVSKLRDKEVDER